MAIVAVVVSLAAVSFSPRQRTYDEAEDLRSAFVELAERSVFDGRARGADIWREGMRALARDGGRWRASGDLLEWEKLRVVSLRVDSARVEILDFADEQERAEEAARRKNPTQSSSRARGERATPTNRARRANSTNSRRSTISPSKKAPPPRPSPRARPPPRRLPLSTTTARKAKRPSPPKIRRSLFTPTA